MRISGAAGTRARRGRHAGQARQARGRRVDPPPYEVENVETALEIAARGHADTIAARGVVHRLAGRLPHRLHSTPLRPRLHDHFVIVHRRHTTLSRATRTLVDLATTRLRQAAARGRQADP
ncbi:type 2 periplasmic-binding domain-containing protein [Streptomyces viridosporus]|uniref:hypothetical protein n=1 Tax=Streptomyces viridosporus TaxID=67581 RepID=UPI0002FAD009|nr:hypothetical protein [Streptomyces viridosporus]